MGGPLTPPEHPPTFLSPLDNLLWDRPRVKRVFGFEHTFEIYKKPEQRRYGYYVLLVQGLWLEGAAVDAAGSALRHLVDHLDANDITLVRATPPTTADAVRRALG